MLNLAAYWKSSNTETCAKKLSQIFANNNNNGYNWRQDIGLRIYMRIYLKNKWKVKGGLKQPGIFLLFLNYYSESNILDV